MSTTAIHPPTRASHPARYTPSLLPVFASMLRGLTPLDVVLDPMAGTGERLTQLQTMLNEATNGAAPTFVGIEIEPLWIRSELVRQGDATKLPFRDGSISAIVVSPTYGNGVNDYFVAKEGSVRNTYIHRARALADDPTYTFDANNTSRWHYGTEQYNTLHMLAWQECIRVLVKGGRFILNTKNSLGKPRGGVGDDVMETDDAGREVQNVTGWHIAVLELLGLTVTKRVQVAATGLRQGANRERVEHEDVTLLRKIR